ncbi:hydroxyacylglutathione hydrolase [Moritella marina ATCC 15381]|uniref:Hydroxyacylglutathione hydrolase n=1 Tax=Moritella marina ATCC 15381 TaxID=1202962 RepID=A0A5J6WLB2_MORMI|nr:hydroxyacylglutathione hydrolase [Moritella marina]QFI38946.1 hydroxyacylglutathione hydrolase [Moritella marina ATCC 15381]
MLEVISIPTFNDNYVWLIKNTENNHCCIVDPGQADPVLQVIEQQNLILDAILITHHHFDHVDGISDIISACINPVQIYSSIALDVDAPVTLVTEKTQLNLLDNSLILTVMATPGHKREHVVYYNQTMLFSGDTLFSGGCGRILDGSATELFSSLQRIKALDENTLVYPAHEYTQANLMFCYAVEPQNNALKQHIEHTAKLRQRGLPTVPNSLKNEKEINVFLRTNTATVSMAMEHKLLEIITSELAVFTALRAWKDHF